MHARAISLFVFSALLLSGCSHFSKSQRQQRAYEKYVRRSSVTRVKNQSRFRTGQPQMPTTPMVPSEPVENVQTGPQSVTSGGGGS